RAEPLQLLMHPQPVARMARHDACNAQVVALRRPRELDSAYNLAGAEVAVPLAVAHDDSRP
ncbi:MAG TPA: hypothetical protein VNS61_03615, partial [Caldimonas sp.]|nr:hypothetical protein [Caldimonas sp.]